MPPEITKEQAEKLKKIKAIYRDFLIQIDKLDHEQLTSIKNSIEEMDKKRQADLKKQFK